MSIRAIGAWLFAALAFCLMPGRPALLAADSEDELKSAAVWLFVQYAHLEPAADGSITVGIVGRASLRQALVRTLRDKSAGGHPIRVIEAKSNFRGCQILYLATDRTEEIRRALEEAPAMGVLTIGESDRFLDEGGAVNLFIVDGHISFETSLHALERCGVTISANLLKFGQIRNPGKGPVAK